MKNYHALAEKEQRFQEVRIDTLPEFERKLQELSADKSLRFRGINEAKFHMISSLQRLHPDDQDSYLKCLLAEVKADPLVQGFFAQQQIFINDISVLALMQHYGLPTPLIDFTTEIKNAAAFAADNVAPNFGAPGIDDYVSIYYFSIQEEREFSRSLQDILAHGIETGKAQVEEFIKSNPGVVVDYSLLKEIDAFASWEGVSAFSLCFIEYQAFAARVTTLKPQGLIILNPNLINQRGCFVVNHYSDDMPLEDNWNGRTDVHQFGPEKTLSVITTSAFPGVQINHYLHCLDIRKEVIAEWAAKNPIALYDNSPQSLEIKAALREIFIRTK